VAIHSWARLLGRGAVFLVGVSCEPRIPVTINADSAAHETPPREPEDPENAGRLADCAPSTADCDRDHGNGCEVSLVDDANNCGRCGHECAAANAETGCLGGVCRVIHCAPGFCDSDDDPANGCELAARPCPGPKQ